MGPISENSMPNMSLPAIRSKYPMGDRAAIWLSCSKNAPTPSQYLREMNAAVEFDKEFKEPYQ